MNLRPLRTAAHVELASLLLMFANLATVHEPSASSLLGPTHGCAYLFVVAATWRHPRTTPAARATALTPGIGGLLALRILRRSPAVRETVRR